MESYSLCYFGTRAKDLRALGQAVARYRLDAGNLDVYARTAVQLQDEGAIQSFVNAALSSNVVLVALHGDRHSCPAFELLVNRLEEWRQSGRRTPYMSIQPQFVSEDATAAAEEHSDGFGTDVWQTINSYHCHGGTDNFYQMLLYLRNLLFGGARYVKPPERLPHEGIYHPDFSTVPDLDEYIEAKVDPSKLTVGLWFHQLFWIGGDLSHIDAIIREVEEQGANIIPVFHLKHRDPILKNNDASYVVDKFFMDNAKARIDVLINQMFSSLTMRSPEYSGILPRLDVPCIHAMFSLQPYASWKESAQGMSTSDVVFSVTQPEFDGVIITAPIATTELSRIDPVTGALLTEKVSIPERVARVVRIALKWGALRRKPNSEKKVAVVFHNYPPRNDKIGTAIGLDPFASVKRILDEMLKRGYVVHRQYESGEALAQELVSGLTYDRRWLTPERMAERCEAKAGPDDYLQWHAELPELAKGKITENWGKVPGDLFVHDARMLFPGIVNGNVFLTIQPPRGSIVKAEESYHDLYLSPPHNYLAHYRWMRDVFKADAVLHVGKHGSLEWLPGKAVGLSEECYPDLAISDLPNIYPYIINNPSEGIQAKRRSYCCIVDHLTPALSNADLYEDLGEIDSLLRDYQDAQREDVEKADILRPLIWSAVVRSALDQDLGVSEAQGMEDFGALVERLHSYLQEIGDTMIFDGLHVLGNPPEGDKMVEFIVQLTRLPNGEVPSLRESILQQRGFDYDELLDNRGRVIAKDGHRTGGEIIRNAHETAVAMIADFAGHGFDQSRIKDVVEVGLGESSADVEAVLHYISRCLVPNLLSVTDEIDAVLRALEGRFVSPGPSGAPSRGQADVLPTGRNFFSLDPEMIPTKAAWEVGKRLGDDLLQRYLQETGEYPRSLAVVLRGGPIMRTKGDELAEILYLMGVRPVWHSRNARVLGVEIIPQSELGRPRLDVVPRVAGSFRDAFPNLMELLDDAVNMVADCDEPYETNFLRRNVMRDFDALLEEGVERNEAWREATFRVFGCAPGTYGAGVKELVESKNWKTRDDLGDAYILYSSHAYGRDTYGTPKPELFRRVLSRVDITFRNEDSHEHDMLSCTDYFNYYGGLIAAAASVRGDLPFSAVSDSADPKRVRTRTTGEEAKRLFRARLLNPKWIEGLKRHGFKGAGEISKAMDIALGWDATADVVDDWMYQRLADKFALDPETQKWMREVNPYALQNILEKLLEAIGRGMWQADPEVADTLRDHYLKLEGDIEEITE